MGEMALAEFYLHRDPTKLNYIFNGNNVEEHKKRRSKYRSTENVYIDRKEIDDIPEEYAPADLNTNIEFIEKERIGDIVEENTPMKENACIAGIDKEMIDDIVEENKPMKTSTFIENEIVYDINEEVNEAISVINVQEDKFGVQDSEDDTVPGVRNTNLHPVPQYIKEALMENNKDRGLKFTLSNLMNDQMLLDNFLLRKNRGPITRRKGQTINWSCINRDCFFRTTTVDGQVEPYTGFHNHQENVEKYLKRESRLKLKNALVACNDPLKDVVHSLLDATKNNEELAVQGSDGAIKQCARRFRLSQKKIKLG